MDWRTRNSYRPKRYNRRGTSLRLESLENRELLAAMIDTSTDGSVTIGAEYVSTEMHSAGTLQSEATASVAQPLILRADLEPELRLITRDSYLTAAGLLVRVEVTDEFGKPDRNLWDGTATLTVDNPNVSLSDNRVILHNGLGSVLVKVEGGEDFVLTASYNDLRDSQTISNADSAPVTTVSGTLTGETTIWSGVIHVTGDLTVPNGHTLTLEPGTLVVLDGTRGALDANGTDIIVNGTIESLGTAERPVTFTAVNIDAPWGEIRHAGADGRYVFTQITRGGHASRGGHTNTGPAIRTNDSALSFENSSITDVAGKIMQANDSELTFDQTLFTRAVMGPEIDGSAVLLQDSYIIDMLGIYHEGGVTDDNDGIYIHSQQAGQAVRLVNSVVSHIDDDGIDTLGSDTTIDGVIIRNANTNDGSKGISFLEGNHVVSRTLIVDAFTGISIKAQGGDPNTGHVDMDHVTIARSEIGILAEDKNNIPDAQLSYDISNSIIIANDPIQTDYDPAGIQIRYSNIGEVWPGTGNTNIDPLFADAADNNFHLSPGSPAIDTGDPNSPLDADGTRTDMGAFALLRLADFDGDGITDARDIDALCAATRVASPDGRFDLDHNGVVNIGDATVLVQNILGTHFGDANLDGVVDGTDFGIWSNNRFSASTGWATGDYSCDGVTDGSDFNIWNDNRFLDPAAERASTPRTPAARTPQAAIHGGPNNGAHVELSAAIDSNSRQPANSRLVSILEGFRFRRGHGTRR